MTAADYKVALERAQKMIANPRMFKRENLVLARVFLELDHRAASAESRLAAVFEETKERCAEKADYLEGCSSKYIAEEIRALESAAPQDTKSPCVYCASMKTRGKERRESGQKRVRMADSPHTLYGLTLTDFAHSTAVDSLNLATSPCSVMRGTPVSRTPIALVSLAVSKQVLAALLVTVGAGGRLPTPELLLWSRSPR